MKNATHWIKNNTLQGCCLPISAQQSAPYPEVTGYTIPTLLQVGEHELARAFAEYLITIQNPDGSFSLNNPYESYVFDTSQIIRGWVSIASRLPAVLKPMRNACEWIISRSDPQTGAFPVPPAGHKWSLGRRGEVNPAIHIYAIQPLRDAANILGLPHIRMVAERALRYYVNTLELTSFDRRNALTHFYAYIQEGLFETGHHDLAARGMRSVAQFQQCIGFVPAYYDVHWICAPGLAQLAKVWFLLGESDRALGALRALRELQNYSGGLYGSYGIAAEYFPADEVSWAAKYLIDAELLAVRNHFGRTSGIHPTSVTPEDGRALAVLAACEGMNKVLDAGCGTGRYAALVKSRFPNTQVHAVDISGEMLAVVPTGILTKEASIQDMPFADEEFDVVYCVEALEHAPHPLAALAEMARVVRTGGQLLVIDKNSQRMGALRVESWENWFGQLELLNAMQTLGMDCSVSALSYQGRDADGLFLCWKGTKHNTGSAAANLAIV